MCLRIYTHTYFLEMSFSTLVKHQKDMFQWIKKIPVFVFTLLFQNVRNTNEVMLEVKMQQHPIFKLESF